MNKVMRNYLGVEGKLSEVHDAPDMTDTTLLTDTYCKCSCFPLYQTSLQASQQGWLVTTTHPLNSVAQNIKDKRSSQCYLATTVSR